MWLAMLFRRQYMRLGVVFFVLLITSCVSQTKVDDPVLLRQNQLAQNAQQLLAEGKYQEAVALYRQLADQPSIQQNIFRLQAAEALLKIGDAVTAKAYADLVAPATLTEVWRNRLYLLYAQIHLNAGNAEQAVSRLNLVSVMSLSAQQNIYTMKPRHLLMH